MEKQRPDPWEMRMLFSAFGYVLLVVVFWTGLAIFLIGESRDQGEAYMIGHLGLDIEFKALDRFLVQADPWRNVDGRVVYGYFLPDGLDGHGQCGSGGFSELGEVKASRLDPDKAVGCIKEVEFSDSNYFCALLTKEKLYLYRRQGCPL